MGLSAHLPAHITLAFHVLRNVTFAFNPYAHALASSVTHPAEPPEPVLLLSGFSLCPHLLDGKRQRVKLGKENGFVFGGEFTGIHDFRRVSDWNAVVTEVGHQCRDDVEA